MRSSLIIAALGGLLTLAGCGIKGDLYIPEVPELEPRQTPAAEAAEPPSAEGGADGDDNNLQPLRPQ